MPYYYICIHNMLDIGTHIYEDIMKWPAQETGQFNFQTQPGSERPEMPEYIQIQQKKKRIRAAVFESKQSTEHASVWWLSLILSVLSEFDTGEDLWFFWIKCGKLSFP